MWATHGAQTRVGPWVVTPLRQALALALIKTGKNTACQENKQHKAKKRTEAIPLQCISIQNLDKI